MRTLNNGKKRNMAVILRVNIADWYGVSNIE